MRKSNLYSGTSEIYQCTVILCIPCGFTERYPARFLFLSSRIHLRTLLGRLIIWSEDTQFHMRPDQTDNEDIIIQTLRCVLLLLLYR